MNELFLLHLSLALPLLGRNRLSLEPSVGQLFDSDKVALLLVLRHVLFPKRRHIPAGRRISHRNVIAKQLPTTPLASVQSGVAVTKDGSSSGHQIGQISSHQKPS